MRVLKGALPIAVSVSLIFAATAILWGINSTASGSHHLVYIYLFPVALIAALYNGRLALLCTGIAVISADYFCNCDQVHPTFGVGGAKTNAPFRQGEYASSAFGRGL